MDAEKLYENSAFSTNLGLTDYAELMAKLDDINGYIRGSGNKNQKQGKKSGTKKLKLRIKCLELENERTRQAIQAFMMQAQMQQVQ
ncbi:MAG: hypothetical protein FWE14_00445 [Lachnospiraceae bacterium]|nr:hypothetical protein [Lachnospiraceae bacterium]